MKRNTLETTIAGLIATEHASGTFKATIPNTSLQ